MYFSKFSAKNYKSDENGGVAIISALCLTMLVVAAGMSTDLGRSQILKFRLNQATDSAALAAASADNNLTVQQRTQLAQRFYHLNAGNIDNTQEIETGDAVINFNGTSNSNAGQVVQVRSSGTTQTNFIKLAGTNTVNVNALSEATVQRDNPSLDIILSLDTTGSMNTIDCPVFTNRGICTSREFAGLARIQQVKGAVENFTNKLFNGRIDADNYAISNVFFNTRVRDTTSWTSNYNAIMRSFSTLTTNYAYGNTNNGIALQEAKNIMRSRLSRAGTQKVVIALTDGQNTVTGADALMIQSCEEMKADGVILYSIAFGPVAANDPKIAKLMRTCSTDPNFTTSARSADDLTRIFEDIAKSIKTVRLSK